MKRPKINLKRYSLYLLRWQLSTPILAVCLIGLTSLGAVWATVVANLIGGMIFFWVDRFIFQSEKLDASWQVKERVMCADCKKVTRGYRLVKSKNYDRSHDPHPEYRCEPCSDSKAKELKKKGIYIEHI